MRGTWSCNPFPGPGLIPCCPVSISYLAALHRQHGFLPIEPARQQITVWITGSNHRIEGKEYSALLTGPILVVQLGRRRPVQICSCHSESDPGSLSVDRFMASIIMERRPLPCWTDLIGSDSMPAVFLSSVPTYMFKVSCRLCPYLTAWTEYYVFLVPACTLRHLGTQTSNRAGSDTKQMHHPVRPSQLGAPTRRLWRLVLPSAVFLR